MAQKAAMAALHEMPFAQPKAAFVWGFRRRAMPDEKAPAQPVAAEPAFEPDAVSAGCENFGRGGLQLGGLYRDRQWVGSWGGSC